MKLSDARESFYSNTGTVSELCRKLSYSGLAVIWIIRTGSDLSASYETWWLWILIGYVLSLACDLLQYFSLGECWRRYNDERFKAGVSLDDEVEPPERLNYMGFLFYYVKFGLVTISTVFLLIALSSVVLADSEA